MAIRGYVVDIFPIDEKNPIRLELWGDDIESIRKFDVNTQISTEEIDEITIKPIT